MVDQQRERASAARSASGAGAGRFIVFEGLDGSGTSTQAELLANWYARRGLPAHRTVEPSGGPFGLLLRAALARRLGSLQPDGSFAPLPNDVLALGFAADRLDHLHHEVLPRLAEGTTVICERYYLSSLAYQSLGVDFDWVRELNRRARPPDLTIFLDVPIEVCLERIGRRGRRAELFEEAEQLRQVRAGYERAIGVLRAAGERIVVLDGARPPEVVHADVLAALGVPVEARS